MNEIKISDEMVQAYEDAEVSGRLDALDRGLRGWPRRQAEVRAGLEAAYPLLRQQWEAEFLESLKKHGGDQWQEGYEAGCSMSHSLGCDAVEAQRDHLAAEVERLRAEASDA